MNYKVHMPILVHSPSHFVIVIAKVMQITFVSLKGVQ